MIARSICEIFIVMNKDTYSEADIPAFLKSFKPTPLSIKGAEVMITMSLAKLPENPMEDDSILQGDFLMEILHQRIKAYELPFKLSDMFYVINSFTWLNGRPGNAMIFLRMCYEQYLKTGQSLFKFEDFSEMFPWGVPDEESLQKMWDSQKHRNAPIGNMLDDKSCWARKYSPSVTSE